MNRHRTKNIFLAALATVLLCRCGTTPPDPQAAALSRPPIINPDYTALIIPPNIAPLNFAIKEPGNAFFVDISGDNGQHLRRASSNSEIHLPLKKWQRLLKSNAGRNLRFDVYTCDSTKKWVRFAAITNAVANEPVDDYALYRLIPPLYTFYGKMGLYERRLSDFSERPVWLNRMSGFNCMNCHTFKGNDPDYMVVHMRAGKGNGTLVKQGKEIFKVKTETAFNTAAGNPAWHPGGECIAFSVNRVRQFFHEKGSTREGIDMKSDIILYTIVTNTISTSPALADTDFMETMPEWSPDGRYLYYCRAPQFPRDSFIEYHARIYYDLMRIPFDAKTFSWGRPEPLLTHAATGRSFSLPRVSPDGKFLLCCMADYGNFTAFRPGGDIVVYETATGKFRALDVNTPLPESFPMWSSNGRWMLFTSKRINTICSYLYISHIDSAGIASKPFILPQRDPYAYASLCKTFNFPCFLTKPFALSPSQLVEKFEDTARCKKARLHDDLQKLVGSRKREPLPHDAAAWSQSPRQTGNH